MVVPMLNAGVWTGIPPPAGNKIAISTASYFCACYVVVRGCAMSHENPHSVAMRRVLRRARHWFEVRKAHRCAHLWELI